jgi:hypothetical protein
MCSFTPSAAARPEIAEKTLDAIREMVRAAVRHYHPDHTGPIEFTVHRPNPIEFDPEHLKNTEAFDA